MRSGRFAALVLLAAACASEEVPDGLATDQVALWDIDESVQDSKIWDSGNSSHLSGWEGVGCTTDHGQDYLIAALDIADEPTGNWDDFVARIEATCREYESNASDDYVSTGNEDDDLVYSSNNRGNSHYHFVPYGAHYAGGVKLKVNTNDYVKDIELTYVSPVGNELSSTTAQNDTGWATGYSGDLVERTCPDQEVVTGIYVRYSTNTGKIRQLKINCRPLEHF